MPKSDIYDYEVVRDKTNEFMFLNDVKSVCSSHFHKQLEIIYCNSGEQTILINNEQVILTSGDFAVISPFMAHSCIKSDSYCTIVCIPTTFFSYYSKYFSNLSISQMVIKCCDKSPLVLEALRQCDNISIQNHYEQLSIILGILGKILSTGNFEEQSNSLTDNLLHTIIGYINSNYTNKISLDSLAEHCHYNKYYLSTFFNTKFSCSFTDYINIIRLNAFVELQLECGGTYSDNALAVGFQTIRTFYNSFKGRYNSTPSDFFRPIIMPT